MAFAGTFGAAANLIPFGIINSPIHGAGVSYDANGNLQFQTPGGTVFTPERLDDLFIVGSGDVLAALVDNTDDGSAADSGVLVSTAPAANQHGLPANFGPGRGNWLATDVFRTIVEFISAGNTVALATNTGGPVVRGLGAGPELAAVIKNMSVVALATTTIRVAVRHSIQE